MKKAVILGLGIDTQDVLPWLEKQGYEVTILDEKKGDKFENLEQYDLIVRSPSVRPLRNASSKTKLFFDNFPGKIIGITGTKGKGTTATLIYEILKANGKNVYLGGNIGKGVFDIPFDKDVWVVLELSSFQLIDLHKSPHIAVVLMVTSEHMDWHRDIEEYIEAKKNIVSHQEKNDYAVVNKDYPNSVEIGKAALGKVIWISGKDKHYETQLRGEHNQENIAAAVAVAKILKIPYEDVVRNFRGLEHRLEKVAVKNGVTFYNDSFSTVPETAMAAIKSFSELEILILGGSSKNSDFSELGKTINKAPNIRGVILIGEEGSRIFKLLKGLKNLKLLKDTNMAEIVKMAYNMAKSGDVILLSPACASFGMFKNYKDRGNQFKEAVQNI